MKLLKHIGLTVMVCSVVACTSTVGNNFVKADGTLKNSEIDWPSLEDASLPEGIFPNMANLAKIGPGVTKKDLYYLIERPHFSEMNSAKEWNYIMKFRQEDRSVKVCQYKVLFDDDMVAQSFYWLPEDCLNEKFSLSADALFPFDLGGVEDIKPAGKAKLDKLAARLVKEGNKAKVHLVGHTDYLGSNAYNQALSEERADSVGIYLASQGVDADNITAEGRGESEPVKQCEKGSGREALIDCLEPNRRVTVEINR